MLASSETMDGVTPSVYAWKRTREEDSRKSTNSKLRRIMCKKEQIKNEH